MNTINVPQREEVNETNQAIFDTLKAKLGFVPNLYATYAHSNNALKNYLDFANAKTSLTAKEKEIVNLAVSQVNNCSYCLAAHTAIAGMNGFSEDEILSLRAGKAPFNSKYEALASLAKNMTENRGRTEASVVENFFNEGYTKEQLIDTIALVGEKTISNYLHSTTNIPVDFPAAQPLELQTL